VTGRITARAPGRVNLLGGHVDFHEGVVVAAAIDREVRVEGEVVDEPIVELASDRFTGAVRVAADGSTVAAEVQPAWGRIVAAVIGELDALGRPARGFTGQVTTTLPIGGGLSSSAAFSVAVGAAASAAAGWACPPMELARACQRAELAAAGVPCGIQDPAASVAGGVVRLDCRDLATTALDLPAATSLVVVDSGVPRTLEGSPWAARRAASFEAAAALGVAVLRDVRPGDLPGDADPLARHVVGEIARVDRFAAALAEGDPVEAGRLMVESHASSRDLWRSSTPELDWLVEALVAGGAHGARLTGGGFGGCVVALAPEGIARRLADEVASGCRDRFGVPARAHQVGVARGVSAEVR
jgi:galactokinase